MSDYPYEAKRTVQALIEVLEPFVECDPEQEIRGIVVPLVEAAHSVEPRDRRTRPLC